jgi:hypothetical protein
MAFNLASLSRSVIKPPRIIIYGESGIGKTTLAVCSDNPVVIRTEDGMGTLDAACFPVAKSFNDVMESLTSLYTEKHDFKTLVIDSLDWLEPLIWQHTCQFWTDKKGDPKRLASIEDAGFGKGYVEATGYWREFFSGITALRDDKGMTIIMTAHSETKRVEDPMLASYDTHGLKMHKRASALAEEFADVILFATIQTNMITEEVGFNNKRTRATTTGQRVMHTVGQPAFLAKNRYNLPPVMPLTWAAFAGAMPALTPATPNAL